jgi:hypothetical protein
MDSIECESAEAAPAVLLIGGREVAMIFADVRLRGLKDGIDLAREVKMRWPRLPVILTSGYPRERVGHLQSWASYPALAPLPFGLTLSSKSVFLCRTRTIELAARYKVPAIYDVRDYVAAGGSMSYGASITDPHRQAGVYAGAFSTGPNPPTSR